MKALFYLLLLGVIGFGSYEYYEMKKKSDEQAVKEKLLKEQQRANELKARSLRVKEEREKRERQLALERKKRENALAEEKKRKELAERRAYLKKKFTYYSSILEILPTVEPLNVPISDNLNSEIRKLKKDLLYALKYKKVFSTAKAEKCETILTRIKTFLYSKRYKGGGSYGDENGTYKQRYDAYYSWYISRLR